MAYQFTAASSQYLSAGSTPVDAVPMTLACWARFGNLSGTKAVVSVDRLDNPSRMELRLSGAGLQALVVNTSNGSGVASGPSNVTGADVWTHLAAVFTSTTSRTAYVSGAAGTVNATSVAAGGLNVILVGADRDATAIGRYLEGHVAEVGIWNVALTADEIASLAKGFTPDQIQPQSLVFYAPLVRDLIDQKGALTITNNATATVAIHPRVYA